MITFICGINKYSQLDKNFNKKDSYGNHIIDKSVIYHSEASSFSTNFDQTAWITKNDKCLETGYNIDCINSGSLPKETLGKN